MVQSAPVIRSTEAARWAKALDRALANALDVYVEPVSGEAFVESSSRPGILYAVTATSCTCKAGQKTQICMHRACYLAQIGELPLEPAEPCRSCRGAGSSFSEYWMERRPCDACNGSGIKPDHRLRDVPSFVPIAAAPDGERWWLEPEAAA